MTLDKNKDYRHKNVVFALYELRPNAKWAFTGEDYEGLDWKDDTQTKPTQSELFTKVVELENAEPMQRLREERDRRISECDWIVTRAKETGSNIPTAWKTYRQALRDLPASADPKLDSEYDLDLSSVTWPTKPS